MPVADAVVQPFTCVRSGGLPSVPDGPDELDEPLEPLEDPGGVPTSPGSGVGSGHV